MSQLFISAIVFGTVILFGALGEILTEKSGSLNLGVPGIMYLGGIAGLASAFFYEKAVTVPVPIVCVLISFTAAFAAAALGGLLGSFAIEKDGQWIASYGLKAFSPVAAGYGYSHCDDFGVSRSFGFARKHLGNDLMGSLGAPIVAVEGGVVEAMGWNRYGGWRIGIRSFDSRRYYYYAHLQKDHPFAEGLAVGDMVSAGDLIGFMGRTGYSDKENVNNIETVHLHFGLQLVFDESQKECNSEIWIDVYDIVRLLASHRSSLTKTSEGWRRVYPFRDLDVEEFQ